MKKIVVAWFTLSLLSVGACRPTSTASRERDIEASANTANAPDAKTDAKTDANRALPVAPPDASSPDDDPMATHKEAPEELRALFDIRAMGDAEKARIQPDAFLRSAFKSDGPFHINQGNKAIALHTISRAQCLEGLRDVVLQTPEQRALCGADNMVPVWGRGKPPYVCVDVFEFPNRACELPMVWATPTWANTVCELQGKRLCSQVEWQLACRADPDGAPDTRYAYGTTLDLEVCHTNRKHRKICDPSSGPNTWKTCTTDTEPAGAFPRCRSRFGVFDMHGNVAEIMMRRDENGVRVSQLKGSAWFYTELAREPDKPPPATTMSKDTAYPDHCNFDPRWHVEPISGAWHSNYHLGFRCCKTIH